MTPKTNYICRWRHQMIPKNSRTNPETILNIINLGNLIMLGHRTCRNIGTDVCPKILKLRLMFQKKLEYEINIFQRTLNGIISLNLIKGVQTIEFVHFQLRESLLVTIF